MLRTFGFAGALGLATVIMMGQPVGSALAQPPAIASEQTLCPREAVTIYYARGEHTASEHAQATIARIGAEAQECRPDAIDLITRINAAREGDSALSLAMARLHGVAAALVAEGVPVDRIRVAAQSDSQASPLAEITVLFRKTDPAAGVAATPAPEPDPRITRDAV